MHVPKKYFHDRLVLLLVTSLIFFTVLTVVFISLRIGVERNEGLIVQYRPTLGLSLRYQKGGSLQILSFAVFSILVCVFHILFSMKTYPIRRYLSLVLLAMGVLLTLLSLIISNSLLLLR